MTNQTYIEALKKAQEELIKCDAEADELEQKRARLRQTIIGLQGLTGVVTVDEPSRSLTVTEAIRRLVLTDESGLITAGEVSRRLKQLGYGVPSRSLATILSRLAKEGKISRLATEGHTLYGPTMANAKEGQSYGKRAALISRMRQKRMKTHKESNK